MAEKLCAACRIAIDESEEVCPYCGERQPDVPAVVPELADIDLENSAAIPWNLIAGVVMALTVAVIAGTGWASARREQCEAGKAQLRDKEPTCAIMTREEAKRETDRIRRRLVSELSQWDRMADFGSARMKTNGVLELTARVEEDDPGRRVANFVSSQVQSAVVGRFKVRGLAVNASNGHRLSYRPWSEPVSSKK